MAYYTWMMTMAVAPACEAPPFFYSYNNAVLAMVEAGPFWERLLSTAIVALVAAVVGSLICAAVLKARMGHVEARLSDLDDKHRAHAELIASIQLQRTECELRATHAFATRAEVARVLVDTGNQYHELLKRIDGGLGKVHDRINVVSEDLAAIKARGVPGRTT